MRKQLCTATVLLLALTVLTGAVYPALVTIIAQAAFPRQANASLIHSDGKTIGSELIGQSFTKREYFWGRLSATGPMPYNAGASSGSNYGPLNPALTEAAQARTAALQAAGAEGKAIPVDVVTASGSGLDPHISPAAAEFQVPRVAAARGMTEEAVRELVRRTTQGRQLGVLGEARVHVLRLNITLDQQQNRK